MAKDGTNRVRRGAGADLPRLCSPVTMWREKTPSRVFAGS